MTRHEREQRIAELREQIAEGEARIEERRRAREENPFSEIERMTADQRFTKDTSDLVYTEPVDEPVASPPIRKNDEPATIYRRYDPSPETPSNGGAPSFSDDEELVAAFDKYSDAIEHRFIDLERELVTRDEKIARLEAKVETLTALLGQKPAKLWTP